MNGELWATEESLLLANEPLASTSQLQAGEVMCGLRTAGTGSPVCQGEVESKETLHFRNEDHLEGAKEWEP